MSNDMAATPPSIEERVSYGIYQGGRGGARSDGDWAAYRHELRGSLEDRQPRLDITATVVDAITAAAAQGRDEVVVFDFGCGQGCALEDVVQGRSPDIMDAVRANPDIKLRLIGLTDLPAIRAATMSPQELAAGKDIPLPEGSPPNVSAHIDYYPVTAARTLEKYFESRGIAEIDLALAVRSFRYLPSKNLELTLQSIAHRLRPQSGVLAARQYAGSPLGFVYQHSPLGYSPHLEYYQFDNQHRGGGPGNRQRKPSLAATLIEKHLRFVGESADAPAPNTDIRQEIGFLAAALQKYVTLNALRVEEIRTKIAVYAAPVGEDAGAPAPESISIQEMLEGLSARRSAEENRQVLGEVALQLLSRAELVLGDRRENQDFDKKYALLARLQAESQDLAVQFGQTALVVRKK